jgi:hypothetical protein
MVPMMVTITIFVDVDVDTHEAAEDLLRNIDDAELFAIARKVQYEYDIVE